MGEDGPGRRAEVSLRRLTGGAGKAPYAKLHGRRKGRPLRKGRQRLLDEVLPGVALHLPDPGRVLDPHGLFTTPLDDVWLEIGFGAGEHLAAMAEAHPTVGFIGCEVFVNGVASLLRHMTERGLDNVRVFTGDANLLLGALPDTALGRIFLLFPDPWPKTRHAGRRFLQQASLDQLARVLRDGGELRLASDHPVYVRWALQHMIRRRDFAWQAQRARDWRERPADWPPTRYEAKARAEGRTPIFLRYKRLPRSA